ncbi:MAG TPA: hypothetical protein VIL53_02695 [Solirubrobacterales bacterium]
MAQVTSIVRDRGREIGIVVILVVSVALLSAPTAFGAGDPVASGTLSFKRSSGFKHQLKSNHVKLKPKAFSIKVGSSVDPITGAGTLKLGKITFKKGNKKVVYGSAKATLGANGGKGNIKGSGGKVFSLSGGTVARNGFGATISGVKVKLLKGAAKKINRKLELHSLHKGSAGSLGVAEQPQTVQIVSGEAIVTPDARLAAGSGTVASKLVAHCIDPLAGVTVIPPATTTGPGAPFHFPVNGGTVSPAGNDGVLQAQGGVRLLNGKSGAPLGGLQPASCPAVAPGTSTSTAYLEQTNLATNLALLNIQADVFLGGTSPPNVLGGPGPKGVAIGQVIDGSNIKVDDANPTTHHIKISGALIKNNAVSSLTLNLFFPLAGTPGGGGAVGGPDPFADGDIFGTAVLDVTVR